MLGQTIKHYRIEEELGKGGMGVVYRARDSRLERSVALKLLPQEFTADPDRRRRFLQEARAASAVTHPAIAQVYDVDEEDGAAFIVMERVEGKTLRSLIQGRELDLLGAIEIAMQVAGGLAKAHEAGIVHRDIKAENIMVTPDGHAKILDFGLARLLEPPRPDPSTPADDISHMETVAKTQAGMVLGTLRYMSPEQARGQPTDNRSDIFSLGVVLYEMVTGAVPFSGETPLDTLHAIAFQETKSIMALRPGLPFSLQRVIDRCLRKSRDERYEDARHLASDLKDVKREIESGITSSASMKDRIREALRSLRDRTPAEWATPMALAAFAIAVLVVVVAIKGDVFGALVPIGIGTLLVYRRLRNRNIRLMRRFADKSKKMPEVRMVVVSGQQATVVVDNALAKTYVRINSLMEGTNRKMFFGDPFTVVVRDSVTPEETRAFLTGPGVLYVRPDVLESN
jgi:serine/threonine protein kinase